MHRYPKRHAQSKFMSHYFLIKLVSSDLIRFYLVSLPSQSKKRNGHKEFFIKALHGLYSKGRK